MGEEDEEDYGALIYRESQLRKAEAAQLLLQKMQRKRRHLLQVNSTSCTFNSGNCCCYKQRCGECCKRGKCIKEEAGISNRRRGGGTKKSSMEEAQKDLLCRWVHKPCMSQGRSVRKAWGKDETIQQRRAKKDAQIKLRKEECVKGMGQRFNTKGAAVKDAQT
jgi:hypothetical protein